MHLKDCPIYNSLVYQIVVIMPTISKKVSIIYEVIYEFILCASRHWTAFMTFIAGKIPDFERHEFGEIYAWR